MPIYDYECNACGKKFDMHYSTYSASVEDLPNLKCPRCKSKNVEKLISKGTSFILKGKGWAKDKYGK